MADPLRNAGGSSTTSDDEKANVDYDEELDFCSPKFNPERALHTPNISVPYPEIKAFPTVKSYEDAIRRRQQQQHKQTLLQSESSNLGGKSLKKQQGNGGTLSVQYESSVSTESTSRKSETDEKCSKETLAVTDSLSTVLESSMSISMSRDVSSLTLSKTSSVSSQKNTKSSYNQLSSAHEQLPDYGHNTLLCSEIKSEEISSCERQSTAVSSVSVIRSHERSDAPSSSKNDEKQLPSDSSSHGSGVVQKAEFKDEGAEKITSSSNDAEISSLPAGKGTRRSKTPKNVFTRMHSMTGPLHLLSRCVQEHLHVRVMTRGAVSVRGICRGYIVAFDKHFNMAMIDVDEIYRRPTVLGKIKSRRSHKLLAAQKTLQKEREEYQTKWRGEQEISNTGSSFQDLSIKADVRLKDQQFLPATSQQTLTSEVSTSDQSHQTDPSISKPVLLSNQSMEKTDIQQMKVLRSSQIKLRRIQSVYEGLKAPLSPFEREALMLGIPDENVNHRHVNQLFIRGENVVSVSIIEDI